ncbi:MAG: ParB/RepB/Spo0J family partition protein [Verrucomicrobiaceae bacterium]|nr:MAG: ParB/RepB/Spo0J family partition protein [Verrucomicrobiaceae bacterium]
MDEEVDELQEAQDQILRGMVNEEGLQSKFKDPANKQVEPVLLNELGFVINGNRRLCCWRMLLEADSEKYSHFRHIDVVVLPHCDEKELDRLEAKLQIEKDIRSDYSWDAEANMMARKMELHGFSTEEIGKLYGKKKSEVENILAMLALAGNYLESRQKKNEWSEVKGHKYAFQELLKTINGVSSHGDKELIKTGAFSLIDDSGSAGERLYEVIPKIKEHLAKVKEELETEFPLPPVETDSTAEAAFGRTKTATGNQDKSSELRLVAEIKKDEASVKKAREVIIETIRSQDDIAKERQAADYLFKTLRKMNGTFASLVGTALRPESSTKGVAKQIEEIKTAVEHVEDWLNERMNTAKE